MTALSGDPMNSAAFDRVETDLHLDILGFSPNTEILAALRRTHLLFGPTRHLVDPLLGIPTAMIEGALREHLTIMDLLLDSKTPQAVEALRRHLSEAEARWLARFEKAARVTEIEYPSYLPPLGRARHGAAAKA